MNNFLKKVLVTIFLVVFLVILVTRYCTKKSESHGQKYFLDNFGFLENNHDSAKIIDNNYSESQNIIMEHIINKDIYGNDDSSDSGDTGDDDSDGSDDESDDESDASDGEGDAVIDDEESSVDEISSSSSSETVNQNEEPSGNVVQQKDEKEDKEDDDYSEVELVTPQDLKYLYNQTENQLTLKEKLEQGIIKEADELEDVLQANTNILILAYARSGSSYTGNLLSALSQASYFFEPLWALNQSGLSIEKAVQQDKAKVAEVRDTITGIFNCDDEIIRKMKRANFKILRKNGNVCNATNPKVIKTIRLHKPGLEPWIYTSGIKVVHLVRDPRGMIGSVAAGKSWGDALKNATYQCTRVRDDLSLEARLEKNYIRVRYEDLVDNPEGELQRIYHSLRMPFTGDVKRVMYEHTHAPNNTRKGYYNTYREEDFHHDSWKSKLSGKKIEMIEEACKDIMDTLDYRPYKSVMEEHGDSGKET